MIKKSMLGKHQGCWLCGLALFLLLSSVSCTNALGRDRVAPLLKQNVAHDSVSLRIPSPFAYAFPSTKALTCGINSKAKAKKPVISFVKTAGTHLVYKGAPLRLYGYTFYPAPIGGATAWRQPGFSRYIDHILDMGASLGQNLVRPTDFWTRNYQTSKKENEIIWKNMDYLVCAAQKRKIFVVMDVSAYAWFLQSKGHNMDDLKSWLPFLQALGAHYKLQSVIAFYSILGEPAVPKNAAQMNALLNFYRKTTMALRHADSGHHLITAGGFNHMEDESAKLPWWRLIYALPTNDIGAFKTYSQRDLLYIPTIAAYGRALHKPVIDEEFGAPQYLGDSIYSGAAYNNIHVSRATFFDAVYLAGIAQDIAGFVFWNMGCEIKQTGYEVSPRTPGVWNVVKRHAPLKPNVKINETKLCA